MIVAVTDNYRYIIQYSYYVRYNNYQLNRLALTAYRRHRTHAATSGWIINHCTNDEIITRHFSARNPGDYSVAQAGRWVPRGDESQLENRACGSAAFIYHNKTTFAATIDAFSGLLVRPECICGWGSTQTPLARAYSALPDSLAGWEGLGQWAPSQEPYPRFRTSILNVGTSDLSSDPPPIQIAGWLRHCFCSLCYVLFCNIASNVMK